MKRIVPAVLLVLLAFSVLVSNTGTAVAAEIDHYHVESNSYVQTAGVPFTVTVTAHDRYHNVVNDNITQVTLTPDPELTIVFDANDDGFFVDRTKTLMDGTFTITARCNKAATNVVIHATSDNTTQGASPAYTFTQAAVNNAPVASPDQYEVDWNSTLDVAAPGVLGNDTDKDGGTLTAVQVAPVSHGTLTLNPDGSFRYIPESDFTGNDSFTYRGNDGTADSNVATVTIAVSRPGPTRSRSDISPGIWIGSTLAAAFLVGVLFLYWQRNIRHQRVELDSVAALKVKMARMDQRLKESQAAKKQPNNSDSKPRDSRWKGLRSWIGRFRRDR